MLSVLFWLSLALLIYTYIGYPALLWAWGIVRPRVIRKDTVIGSLTIVIVAYNEERRIVEKLKNCLSLDYPADRLKILVCSDGSTDRTALVVKALQDERIELREFVVRRGKAACLHDLVGEIDSDYILFSDVRQFFKPDAALNLLRNFHDPSIGAVSGELVFDDTNASGFSRGIDFYWRYEKFIRRNESAIGSVVGVTGAIYALRTDLFRDIRPGVILDDLWIPMEAAMQGYRVVFEADAEAIDIPAIDQKIEKIRKVRTIAGNWQYIDWCRYALNPKINPIWFQFVSHKVLRLSAPAFMAIALLTNLILSMASQLFLLLLVPHLAIYIAGLVAILIPRTQSLSVIRIPMAFLSLNWFAVLGCLEYFKSKDTYLWNNAEQAS